MGEEKVKAMLNTDNDEVCGDAVETVLALCTVVDAFPSAIPGWDRMSLLQRWMEMSLESFYRAEFVTAPDEKVRRRKSRPTGRLGTDQEIERIVSRLPEPVFKFTPEQVLPVPSAQPRMGAAARGASVGAQARARSPEPPTAREEPHQWTFGDFLPSVPAWMKPKARRGSVGETAQGAGSSTVPAP